MPSGPLGPGEPVLLIDRRRRRYLIHLRRGGTSDLRGGRISHDTLIGQEDGGATVSTRGERLLVIRPTLAEFVLEMPRGAQVVYPKDLGAILVAADIFPGARVLEAGTGSGALTMALLRAVGPTGGVISYEIREEFARIAEQNIRRFLGSADALVLRQHDIYSGILPQDTPLDRIVLDLPEPWRVAESAGQTLAAGGILLCYLPTIPQVVRATEALQATGAFGLVETVEILMRPWNIESPSVRPAHRMVAHTGFLTTARRITAGTPAASFASVEEGEREKDDGGPR